MNKRINMLQILRGFAILLVLIHHSISNVDKNTILLSIDNIIICIHMPLFFIISGYLFELKLDKYRSEGAKKFFINKIKHIIFPYLFWTIILWLGVQIVCSISSKTLIFMNSIGFGPMSFFDLVKGILTYEIYYTQHLWFLYVLFLLFAINYALGKNGATIIILVISFIFGLSTALINYPNIINRLFMWGIYFSLGRYILKNKSKLDNVFCLKNKCKKNRLLLGVTLFLCLSIFFKLYLLSYENLKIVNVFISYLIGIFGILLLYLILTLSKDNKFLNAIKRIGDYSYDIYLIHNPYLVATSSIILTKLKVPVIIVIIVSVIIGIVFSIIIGKFLRKYLKNVAIIALGK